MALLSFALPGLSSCISNLNGYLLPAATAVMAEDGELNLDIYSIDLEGNGDSTLIDFGESEILIDAGLKKSVGTVTSLIDEKVDGDLEMVILTHGDNDHIGGFPDILNHLAETGKKIKCLIDFDNFRDTTIKHKEYSNRDSVYESVRIGSYRAAVDAAVPTGQIQYHYSAAQICYGVRNVSYTGLDETYLSPTLSFDSEGNISKGEVRGNLNMRVLYNYFYDHGLDESLQGNEASKQKDDSTAADANILSVCTLFEYEESKMLFCGDLVEFASNASYKRVEGETKLLEENDDYLYEPIAFYKASHHGSNTSSSDALLDVIRPKTIAISCETQYNFPSIDVLQRLFQYTDRVYINRKAFVEGDANASSVGTIENGTIKYRYVDGEFLAMFGTSDVYMNSPFLNKFFISTSEEKGNTSKSNSFIFVYSLSSMLEDAPVMCTYIKIGHIDILIDIGRPGVNAANSGVGAPSADYGGDAGKAGYNAYYSLVRKVEKLCNDKVLDYLILSANSPESFGYLIGNPSCKGLLNDGYLESIENFIASDKIPSGYTAEMEGGSRYYGYKDFVDMVKAKRGSLIKNLYGRIFSTLNKSVFDGNETFYPYVGISSSGYETVSSEFAIKILKTSHNTGTDNETVFYSCSLPALIQAYDYKFLSYGFLRERTELDSVPSLNSDVSDVSTFILPNYGMAANKENIPSKYLDSCFANNFSPSSNGSKASQEYCLIYNGPVGLKNTNGSSIIRVDNANNFKDSSYLIYQAKKNAAYNGDLGLAVSLFPFIKGTDGRFNYSLSMRCTKPSIEDGKTDSVSLYDQDAFNYNQTTKPGLAKSLSEMYVS